MKVPQLNSTNSKQAENSTIPTISDNTAKKEWIKNAVDPLSLKNSDKEEWISGAVDPLTIEHIPESVKGTKLEEKQQTLENIPYGLGSKGFDLGVELDEGLLPFALKAYKGLSPDEASRVQQISKMTQIDPKIIFSNNEKWKDWDNEKQIYLSLFKRKDNGNYKYPWTANHLMTDPLLLKQIDNSEIQNLQKIEDIILSHRGSWFERTPHLLLEGMKDIVKGGLGTVQAYTEFFANPTQVKRSPFFTDDQNKQLDVIFSPENIKKRDEEIRAYFDVLRNETKLQSRPLRNIGGFGQFYNDFIQMLPQMGATIASGIVAGPLAGAGFMGQYIGGSDYGGKRDSGISKDRALVGAMFNATAQSALEYVGLSNLLKLIKTTGGTKKVLVNFFKTLIAEGGTETLQSFPESVSDIWGKGELKNQSLGEMVSSFIDKLPQTLKQGAYEGLVVMPSALLGGMASLHSNIKYERALKRETEKYNKLAGVSKDSKLRETNPEQFATLIDKQLEKNKINSSVFFVDYLDYVNMFASSKSAAEMSKKLGIAAEVEKSISTGEQIPIKLGKWHAYNNSVSENVFYKNARPEKNGNTFIEMQREIHEERDRQKEPVEKLIEFYKKSSNGRLVFEELGVYTLQDKIDSGELTEIEAEKLIEDHGWSGKKTPLQINILGSNQKDGMLLVDGKEQMKYIVKIAKGASPYTVIEEVSEAWFKNKFGYDTKKDVFEDSVFNSLLKDERKKAENNGYTTAESNMEWLSTIAINYAKNNSNKVFNSFSEKFKKQIQKIALYIKELLASSDKIKKLVESGVFSREFIGLVDSAVSGNFDTKKASTIIQQIPEVQEAKKVFDSLKNTRNRRIFSTSNILKDSPVTDKIHELGGISKKPKNYIGGEYDEQIPYRNKTYQFAVDKKNWNKQLDDYLNGDLNVYRNAKVLSITPEILQVFDAKNLPIRIHPNILRKVITNKHDITIEQLKQIIDHLYNPTAVFEANPNESRKGDEALVIFTDMLDSKNKPIMISLLLDKKEARYEINAISSIYGKNNSSNVADWINLGLLRYVNTKRVSKLPYSFHKPIMEESTIRNSKYILTQDSKIVKPILKEYQELLDVEKDINSSSTENKTYQLSTREISTFDLPDSLEKVTVQTNFSTLTKQPGYEEAKRAGNNRTAFDIVNKLIKKKKIDELKAKLDPDKPVYIIPITNYENSKQLNRLPYAYASALEDAGIGSLFDEIIKKSDTPNTGKTQIERLSAKHEYVGDIPDKNAQYVIVDDMFTSGNTIMPLIELIKKQGGEVTAVSSLAFSRYGTNLKLRQETLDKIIKDANIKDRELIAVLSKATQNEGNIIYDHVRKRKSTTEQDIRSFIDPKGSQTNSDRASRDVPSTSYQLVSAEILVKSYIQNYEKIDKLKNTFDKFGATFYSDDAYELKFDLLKAISTITGRELPNASVLAELSGGGSVQKALKSRNVRNALKVAEDNYVRETKQWIKANKLPHHVVMKRLEQGDLTLEIMEDILDSIKGRLRVKRNVVKKEQTKSRERKKKLTARKDEIDNQINSTTREGQALSNTQTQDINKDQKANKRQSNTAEKINIDNIKEELEYLQREMATLVSALPKSEQWKMKNRIATITQKYGDDRKVYNYFQATLKAMDKVIAEHKKNNAIEEMANQIKLFVNKKDHKGRRIGKTIPKTQSQIRLIRDVLFSGTEKIQDSINNLIALSEEREFTEAEIEDLSILLTFGNIKNKNSEDVLKAQEELRGIIADGIMTRLIFTEADRKRDEENSLKAIDNITGGKGLLKGQAKKDNELKQKTYLSKIASIPGNYQFKHLGFELEMNALSRQDKDSEHLGSWLVKKFAKDVHIASHVETTGVRERTTEHINGLNKIFLAKNNRALFKNFKEFSATKESKIQIYEMEHEKFNFTFEQTAQLLIDYDEGKLHKKYSKYEFRKEKMIEIQEELERRIARQYMGLPVNEVFEIEFDERSDEKWNLKLSQDEAVNYWLLLQQDYVENFFYHGWDDLSIKELENFMTPEAKKYGLELQKLYDEQYDPMNKVYKKHFHIDMPKINNYSKAVFEYNEKDNDIDPNQIASGGAVGTTANPVSIIQRQKHKRNPKQVGASVVYSQSIFESEHFKAFAGTAKELRGTFKDGKVREAIKENYGAEKLKAVDFHIDQLIQGGINSDKINKSIDLLRSSVTKLILSGKLVNLLKQTTSHPAYAFDIPATAYVKYTAEFLLNPIKNSKDIIKTDFIKDRWDTGFNKELKLAMANASGKPKNYLSEVLNAGMLPTRIGDVIPIVAGYYAVYKYNYNKNIKGGLSPEFAKRDAIIQAEMASERTQQAGNVKDLGYFQLQGSAMNLFQMFITSQRQYINSFSETLLDAFSGKKGAKKRAAKKALITFVILPIVFKGVSDLAIMAFDDDYEPEIDDYLVSMLFGSVAGWIFWGNIATFMGRKAFDLPAYDYDISPVGSMIETMAKSAIELGKGNVEKATHQAIRSTGLYQTYKTIAGKRSK